MKKGGNGNGGSGPQAIGQPVRVDLSKCPSVECPECGSTYFTTVFVLKKVSAVLSHTGREELIAIELFRCADCGHVTSIIRRS